MSTGGSVWFTERDIKDAVVGFNDQQVPVINFILASEAKERVARLSARDVGQTVTAVLDDELLVTATVSGPISEGRLQLSVRRPANEVQLIASILKTGALSVTPKSVQFQK